MHSSQKCLLYFVTPTYRHSIVVVYKPLPRGILHFPMTIKVFFLETDRQEWVTQTEKRDRHKIERDGKETQKRETRKRHRQKRETQTEKTHRQTDRKERHWQKRETNRKTEERDTNRKKQTQKRETNRQTEKRARQTDKRKELPLPHQSAPRQRLSPPLYSSKRELVPEDIHGDVSSVIKNRPRSFLLIYLLFT